MSAPQKIVIATRESRLALWQARHVQAKLREAWPACQVELLGMTTRGDQILDRPLAEVGGKGLFVKELETALLDGRADIAVHSMKDVPMQLEPEFAIVAIGARETPLDAFVSNLYGAPENLPSGAIVGTSSLRRQAQLQSCFPGLVVRSLRGNLDTRLRKLDSGEYAAIILAAAGLKRLGLSERIRSLLPAEASLPAAGQGALGIEALAGRPEVADWLRPLHDETTACCVRAERALAGALAGSCDVPLAAFAESMEDQLRLRALVASPDGKAIVRAEKIGPITGPEALGHAVATELRAKGVDVILAALHA